jgi:acetoin utilization deacetylase AcuC-like enzyme
MKLISHSIFLKHNLKGHPESAERIAKALKEFKFEEAVDGAVHLNKVHTQRYISKVKDALKNVDGGVTYLDAGETYVMNSTYKAACFAAGAAIQAADYALKKQPAFALVRPPGHHAHPDWTNGFCIFNNISIAAAHLAGKKQKVLIVDIDMHRGDGTSECVEQLNNEFHNKIFYFSINQQGVFPGMTFDEGNVKNVYLDAGISEDMYIDVLQKELGSLLRSFKPTVVAVSAGFDSFGTDKESHGEQLGCGLPLTRKTILELKKLLDGVPYFAVLEGGYNPESVLEGVASFLGVRAKTAAKPVKKKKKEEGVKLDVEVLVPLKKETELAKAKAKQDKKWEKKAKKAVAKTAVKGVAAKKKGAKAGKNSGKGSISRKAAPGKQKTKGSGAKQKGKGAAAKNVKKVVKKKKPAKKR